MLLLSELFVDIYPVKAISTPPEEIILDLMRPMIRFMANKNVVTSMVFYDGYCFLPLYIFCGYQFLASYLRQAAKGPLIMLAAITKLVGSEDSLSLAQYEDYPASRQCLANDRLMSWCEKNSVKYVFGLQKNDVLLGELATETEEAKAQYAVEKVKCVRFKWFRYRSRQMEHVSLGDWQS